MNPNDASIANLHPVLAGCLHEATGVLRSTYGLTVWARARKGGA